MNASGFPTVFHNKLSSVASFGMGQLPFAVAATCSLKGPTTSSVPVDQHGLKTYLGLPHCSMLGSPSCGQWHSLALLRSHYCLVQHQSGTASRSPASSPLMAWLVQPVYWVQGISLRSGSASVSVDLSGVSIAIAQPTGVANTGRSGRMKDTTQQNTAIAVTA